MKKKYTTIAFDLGNTLIRFDYNISARKIANLCHIDAKMVHDTFFDSAVKRVFERGEMSQREFYVQASHLLGIRIPYRDFIDIWNDVFWEDEKACDIARRLKKRYKLILLSNVNRSHFDHIEKKFDVIKIFDELILSYMVGAIKPEKAIFDDLITRSGGKADEILYIDDREDLITKSREMGIESIRFETAEKLEDELIKMGVLQTQGARHKAQGARMVRKK
jgi:putative hydrolase of the HAD superfamily